ncbi:response regulator [Caballeronia sp. LP006]|jgi:CheY-like chemotaxis protein|uniref:response regulator n=1 Tax=unclassified Caballeronia TaxID=2646786 RepID=UPI0020280250|nr:MULTISPECIES: response regulator [unclassified Caballeronia]MDR5774237.1 response regulator [Caballeronia sp. LZ002]MDR5805770.1 response regulator [Caballeronia sp. LZ001]MDR5827014.1 response regulator [Caballeronia sp. LP006]MDR5849672.1 response regulator [Caballeronia sp. LZ003]
MRKHLPRLLVADDDAAIRAACASALSLEGYDVHTAQNGCAALAEIRRWRPEIALIDVEMPLMDGREVARQLRQADEHKLTLLIAVTALSSMAERAASIRAGFNYHFTKPLRLSALLETLALHASSLKSAR